MDFAAEISVLSAEQAALLEQLLQTSAQDTKPHAATLPRIVHIRKHDVHKPLFIIHGTGGQVLFAHVLARYISPTQPVYGIEAAQSSGDTDARDYVDALRAVQPHGPYWLGGYSAGCLLAFAAAAQLRQAGEEVAFLLLIDPTDVTSMPETSPQTPQQRLQRRFELAMLAGVTPLSPAFPAIEQVNRNLAAVARRFCPQPLDRRIHIIHGTRGAYVSSHAALQSWAALAGGGLVTASIEADHFQLVRAPHAALTGSKIQSWLDELQNV